MVWKRLMLWGCVGFSYIVGIKEELSEEDEEEMVKGGGGEQDGDD